jgi:protein-S-isoprenylcysteine O-methyltransferase Ste14
MFHPGIDLKDVLAFAALIIWPVIPLFWIPVHCFPKAFRKLGFATYIIPFVLWLPLASLTYGNRAFLLEYKTELPAALHIAGWILLIAGTILQLWTGKLLSLRGLAGVPEISEKSEGRIVTGGVFSVVRHPTYLSHTLMFAGIFLISEVIAAGCVALLDFALINGVIIPLEERELLDRFGPAYEEYRKKVPKFFPRPLSRKNQK